MKELSWFEFYMKIYEISKKLVWNIRIHGRRSMESDGQFVETCRLISPNWNWGTTYSSQLNPIHTPTNGIASHVAIMKIEEKYALANNRIKDAVTERMINHALAPSDWMVIIL